jgi:hypothetical protein
MNPSPISPVHFVFVLVPAAEAGTAALDFLTPLAARRLRIGCNIIQYILVSVDNRTSL